MRVYTYTVFDGNPTHGGSIPWPTHDQVPIRGRTLRGMERRIEAETRREARLSGAYEQGDRLSYIIWDNDLIMAQEEIIL